LKKGVSRFVSRLAILKRDNMDFVDKLCIPARSNLVFACGLLKYLRIFG